MYCRRKNKELNDGNDGNDVNDGNDGNDEKIMMEMI
jgi:hypothetical protein